MSGQGNLLDTLFDADFAAAEMARGTQQSLTGASVKEWTRDAENLVRNLGSGQTVTADTIVRVIGLPTESERAARCNNAIGGLFMQLARQGVIRAVGYVASERVSSRGRVLRVWERV